MKQKVCPIFDITKRFTFYDSTRGNEIQEWLDRHPEVEKYAILDDDIDMLHTQMPNFFKTNWSTSVTPEIIDNIKKHFNEI